MTVRGRAINRSKGAINSIQSRLTCGITQNCQRSMEFWKIFMGSVGVNWGISERLTKQVEEEIMEKNSILYTDGDV